MNSTNLAIILGMMQVTKRIPFENPDVLNAVRAMYIISNVIIISLYLMCGKKIKQKNGTRLHPGFNLHRAVMGNGEAIE